MTNEKKWISSDDLFAAIFEQFEEKRQAIFTVTGMSMWPFLCHGRDQVVIEACRPEDVRRGDVVLLRTMTGKYLLHRITKRKEDRIETTGDGNCFRDGFFPQSCVKARVVCMVRKGKKLDCDSKSWKVVFRLWMLMFPIRRQILSLLRTLSRWKQK